LNLKNNEQDIFERNAICSCCFFIFLWFNIYELCITLLC